MTCAGLLHVSTTTQLLHNGCRELLKLHEGCRQPCQCLQQKRGWPAGWPDRFPLEQLLQYSHSEAVQPYIQAKMLLYTGLELCLERGQHQLGYQALARGYALCHR